MENQMHIQYQTILLVNSINIMFAENFCKITETIIFFILEFTSLKNC